MAELSKRLMSIYRMVPQSVVADIGADHGKLIIALVENGIASHGYAVENKKGPFERLQKAVKKAGLEDKIEVIYSDGLKDLPNFVSTIVIAGMGGHLIVEILKRDRLKLANVQTIIVDAHNALDKVRDEITKLGYIISDEEIVLDANKYYEIIKFIKADIAFMSEYDKEFGPILRKEKSCLFKEKYQKRMKTIKTLINKENLDSVRRTELEKEKERLENIL